MLFSYWTHFTSNLNAFCTDRSDNIVNFYNQKFVNDPFTSNMLIMKGYHVILILLFVAGVALLSFNYIESGNEVAPREIPYPEGYREWTHVKTYVVGPKSPAFKFIGGFNHVYANEKAMQGYRTGYFPDGSVIVSDVIEAIDSINIREGKRHHIDVMMKDSVAFSDSQGWGFESFATDSKIERMVTPDMSRNCTNCHSKQKDLVFSDYRK
jgi:hypothetical protein